jgi:hypothetical protein
MKELAIKPQPKPELSTGTIGFFSALIFVFIFVSILVGQVTEHNYLLADPDTYWHVAVGREIWQTFSFPEKDQFSWTFQDRPWIAKEWLSQLVLFAAYSVGSWRGVILVAAAVLALAYALLFAVLSRHMRVTVAIGAVMVALILGRGHFLARPHVFSYPLVVVWVAGLVNAVEEKRVPSWMLLSLMVLWANVHAGFTLGLAIAGVIAAEAVFTSERTMRIRVAIRWAIFLTFALVAARLTPYGYEPLLMTFKLYSAQPLEGIGEWRPFNAKHDVFVDIPLMCLLFLALYFGVKIKFWRLTLVIGLIQLMFLHIRMMALFGLITPILIASSLLDQFRFLRLDTHMVDDPRLFRIAQRFSSRLAYAVVACLVLAVAAAFANGDAISPATKNTPVGAVDYLEKTNSTRHIYNAYDFGGYLIFRGIKTFIDGRIEQLFQQGFMERVDSALSEGTLPELLKEYDISVALVPPNSRAAQQIAKTPGWDKVYSDDVSAVFTLGPNPERRIQ